MRRTEEAAERARRAEILRKLNKLEKEKRQCEESISSLSATKGELMGLTSSWESSFHNGMQSDVVREVSVPGIFEGTTSHQIKGEKENAVRQMKNSMIGIEMVAGDIAAQIGKLHQYIDKLEIEINSLRAAL